MPLPQREAGETARSRGRCSVAIARSSCCCGCWPLWAPAGFCWLLLASAGCDSAAVQQETPVRCAPAVFPPAETASCSAAHASKVDTLRVERQRSLEVAAPKEGRGHVLPSGSPFRAHFHWLESLPGCSGPAYPCTPPQRWGLIAQGGCTQGVFSRERDGAWSRRASDESLLARVQLSPLCSCHPCRFHRRQAREKRDSRMRE